MRMDVNVIRNSEQTDTANDEDDNVNVIRFLSPGADYSL